MLIRDAASQFIRHCQSIRKLSPHTIRAYELDLSRFVQFRGRKAAVASCDKTVQALPRVIPKADLRRLLLHAPPPEFSDLLRRRAHGW